MIQSERGNKQSIFLYCCMNLILAFFLQDKLAKTDFKLENRKGSQADKTRLEETFRI